MKSLFVFLLLIVTSWTNALEFEKANIRLDLPINGTPSGGTLILGNRTGTLPTISITTTSGESTNSIAQRLAQKIRDEQPPQGPGAPSWYTYSTRRENTLIFDNSSPVDYYLSGTDTGLDLVATPSGLAVSVSGTAVTCTWNSVAGATEYVVFRNGKPCKSTTLNTISDELSSEVGLILKPTLSLQDSFKYTVIAIKGTVASPPSTPIQVNNPLKTATASNIVISTDGMLPDATIGVAYSKQLIADGGTGTLVWADYGNTLPEGLSLSSAGLLSGTLNTQIQTHFRIKVTDSNNIKRFKTFSLTVKP